MIKELGSIDRAMIYIVAEDTIEFDTPFMGRFGFSALLELQSGAETNCILYDTNTSAEPILHNMALLGKSIHDVSAIFLSHCHYDHTDGLAGILKARPRPVPVIAHPEIFRPCFEINPDGIRHIGILAADQSGWEQLGAVLTLSREPLNLLTGVTTSGEIERATSFEALEDLYTITDGRVVQDHERDDMALVLRLERGLVIISGCCHAGIVNTMRHARRITGVEEIHAVVGGLHLIDADEEKIEKSTAELRSVDWVFAGHCTGFKGLRRIATVMGDRFAQLHTGSIIQLPVVDPALPIRTLSTAQRAAHRG
jgi:7,8-dihydropterin-6-yl-methyl-4-(beta-D-ribofuranosyl)aminobenzene 5'-phosphate synthase